MVKQKRKSLVDQQSTNKKASKVNWSSSGATEHTKECRCHFDWLHPKSLSIKNRYYDRKVGESLKIDMAVGRYGQDKVLNRDNRNFVKVADPLPEA